jgi:hypothetical protein
MTLWLILALGIVVVAVLAAVVMGLVLAQPSINAAVATLRPPTTPVPTSGVRSVTGVTSSGEQVHIATVGRDADLLLAFLDSSALCSEHWQALAAGEYADTRRHPRPVVLVRTQRDLRALEGVTILLNESAWSDFGVRAAPHFVLVDGENGSIRAALEASTTSDVDSMLNATDAPHRHPKVARRQLLSFDW